MRTLIVCWLFAAAVTRGQEVIETPDGSYRAFQDELGRYVRFEGDDATVHHLYDSPSATEASGLMIDIAGGPTLTVHYGEQGTLWAPGMPKLEICTDGEGRVEEVRADGRPIASFAYRSDHYVDAVSIPGHLTMRVTPPDGRHRVRQTLAGATGAVIRVADVVSSADAAGMWKHMSFEPVVQALGFDPRSLSFQPSPTGYVETGRDAEGRVALYIVLAGTDAVGFTPDGIPRFYDVAADIFACRIPAGGDTCISVALEQSKAVPAQVTLTADGMPGIYIEEPANGAIHAAWVERDGRGVTVNAHVLSTSSPEDDR